ncbi:ABC transporter ATP-binding protein [Phycisphaera mikurensis]|uniref:Putative ABC transporter ATP-binding protein n=1 Tax=Phycisphaera mikurensis (strain NBRC 102666 / KCTC 22515 / FYK2301M01) TaxID=1142394 RepID=I0IEW7_PHYMF|nr:ABC transporter ATP-binding protein [Phycisphaera mikurensis]MBB6441600.1 ABC-2 type transport system ATP-binding protein [Phycisphaera mikurensis]BAM03805.1 putative ABC transporter ATP-binding protein [Phycisphaera mikurensis NBRC 102666]
MSDAAPPAVLVEGLRHAYAGGREALRGVGFRVEPGEIAALLGPNGSGKSTAFRILATLMRPAAAAGPSGRVEVFGACPWENPHAVREKIGVVFQSPSLDGELTAEENLRCQGRLQGLRGASLREAVGLGLERAGLVARRGDRVRGFSGGMKRRLEVAKAMLHGPELLLLDEPDAGLDPAARATLWEQLDALRHGAGATVLLTTHLMDLAARADRLVLLDRGSVVRTGTAAELVDAAGGEAVRLEPADGDAAALADDLRGEAGLSRLRVLPHGPRPALRLRRADAAAWVLGLRERWPDRFSRVSYGPATLEDAFVELIEPAAEVEPAPPARRGRGRGR